MNHGDPEYQKALELAKDYEECPTSANMEWAEAFGRALLAAKERIAVLEADNERLREDMNCRGVHSCHKNCTNPFCLTRKERDQLRAQLAASEAQMAKMRGVLDEIHMMACYASEENVDSREEMLLKIGQCALDTISQSQPPRKELE